MPTPRRSRPLNLTPSPAVRAALERLAEEDAAAAGRPVPNLTATLSALVLAEDQRREKGRGPGPEKIDRPSPDSP